MRHGEVCLRRATLALLLTLPSAALVVCCHPQAQQMILRAADPASSSANTPHDPASWGSDHVGVELPEFIEGGECLFCHRHDVGPNWVRNRHALTVHELEPQGPLHAALAAQPATVTCLDEIGFVLGGTQHARFLRKSQAYGHMDLLSASARRGRGGAWRVTSQGQAQWDGEHFAHRCAGCHMSHVESETQSFRAIALDCSTCHGEATEDHANEPALILFAKERRDPAAVVVSACGSCHLRFGKSRSTGLPYPNQFVAGDNLFRDFEVDWARADDPELNPGDRHILDNARQVALEGREDLTCISCHTVHARGEEYGEQAPKLGGTERHRRLADEQYCRHCHAAGRPLKEHLTYEVHSPLCEY